MDMTQSGKLVPPAASPTDAKLLEAKYKIFKDSIDVQRRWRTIMDEAAQ